MDIPRGLRSSVRRFAGQRRRVRLTLSSGSTTITANDILRVRLPSRSLVDLGSFGFTASLATTANNYVAGVHTLIRRLGMTCGGVQVGFQNNHYSQVAHAFNLASRGLEADHANCAAGVNPKEYATNGDIIEANYFPLSPLDMGMLWTETMGECEVDIAFHGTEPIITLQNESPAGTWTLSNIVAYVDVIDLETDAYPSAIRSALSNGASYEKLIKLATAVVQENTATNSINLSTKCLDKVLFAPKYTNYLSRDASGAQVDGQVYSNFLDFPTGATAPGANYGVYVEIGGQPFPQYGYSANYQDLAQLTRGCYGNGPYNFNKLFIETDASGSLVAASNLQFRTDAYVERNAVCMIPVASFDEEGVEGGLDLSSGNSVIIFNSRGANLLTRKCLLAGIHKSTLSARAGQVVSLAQ